MLAIDMVVSADPPLPSIGAATQTVTLTPNVDSPSVDAANATAILNAISAVSGTPGGGTVIIPSGTYFSGQIDTQAIVGTMHNVDLEVDGTLEAASKTNFVNDGNNAFIWLNNVNNFEISGTGIIDGNGNTWWPAGGTRPALVNFSNGKTTEVTGITAQNSPMEHFTFSGSTTNDVTFKNVTITAPSTSPNTDGIDPNGANFLLANVNISTGDDNIAIKAGSSNSTVNNVTIVNSTFGYGHGLSIGGQTNKGVNNVTVNNVTFTNTQFGIRMKAGYNSGSGGTPGGGLVQNLNFNNITMSQVQYPVYISSWYDGSGFTQPTNAITANSGHTFGATNTPQWQNITISNLTSTATANVVWAHPTAGLLYGLPESRILGLTFINTSISAPIGMNVDYAGTTASPIDFSQNDTITFTSGTREFGTFSNPSSQANPGSLSRDIVNSVILTSVPEPVTASMLLLAPFALMIRPKKTDKTA